MVQGLPPNYLFMLLPCYKPECPHPECAKGKPEKEHTWFPGGPPLSTLPIPIPDPGKPWGGQCNKCIGNCTGHYLTPEHINYLSTNDNATNSCQIKPPRELIKEYVKPINDKDLIDLEYLSKTCLLSVEDASFCAEYEFAKCEKRRTKKDARKREMRDEEKNENDKAYCFCRKGEEGFMIQCDFCEEWFNMFNMFDRLIFENKIMEFRH